MGTKKEYIEALWVCSKGHEWKEDVVEQDDGKIIPQRCMIFEDEEDPGIFCVYCFMDLIRENVGTVKLKDARIVEVITIAKKDNMS